MKQCFIFQTYLITAADLHICYVYHSYIYTYSIETLKSIKTKNNLNSQLFPN